MIDSSHSLTHLLRPSSIAIIGASQDLTSLSGRPLDILLQHKFRGRLYPVNPNRDDVAGIRAFATIDTVPERVDLAVIAVRASLVLGVLRECATAGVRTAIVFSSGFAEEGEDGRRVQAELTQLAQTSGMRILGPNAEGYFNVHDAIPVTFSPAADYKRGLTRLHPGNLAVVSQSGGLGFALFNWGQSVGLGSSFVITTGNESDLEVLECVEYLLEDSNTDLIAMLVEGFREPDRLAAVATRARELGKQLIVGKLGRSEAGSRAAWAHTAHRAGDDGEHQAEFGRLGIVQANDQEDLVDIAFALSRRKAMHGPNVGILTSSGGAGVWLADACHDVGLIVPELDLETQTPLRALMPSFGSPLNPVDVTAQVFGTGGIAPALETLCCSPRVDAVAMICSLASPHMLEKEEEQIAAIIAATRKPVLIYTYTRPGDASVELLARLGVPWYTSPRRVACALAALELTGRAAASRAITTR